MKSGLHLLGFLVTADDFIQLQLQAKKLLASATNSLQEAQTQVRLFQSHTQTPAIRVFLTNLLFSEVCKGLPSYSALSETPEVLLWLLSCH